MKFGRTPLAKRPSQKNWERTKNEERDALVTRLYLLIWNDIDLEKND